MALIHGSRDSEYVSDVDSFFKRIGISYIFLLEHHEGIIPESFPLFLNWGRDYERALRFAGHRLNPLLGIEEFINGLKGRLPKTIIIHGSSDTEALRGVEALRNAGFEVRFLLGEPSVYSMECPSEAYLLFLFKGVIVKRAAETIKVKCPLIKLNGPLSSEPWFPSLVLRVLKSSGLLD
ncbi:conserved hypothetical protein [Caldivirga maquilingensis IC-167]|uniref:Rhodanese domain-containing protein n=1 Tax=Caldivirga maquilingensis (strain ATCC 700844 / DSM 13496 / JCM 10307 / IC-167) TaxID=397948 RepID=A8MCR9_CALMQ|nr:conserved hypothetical protein [Caldivirga maquilingensis IC-167]